MSNTDTRDMFLTEASLSPEPPVSEFDLTPPPLRKGFVFRQELVELLRSTDADVIVLTAPTGYGKTTVLAQWASVETRPLAWLSLTRDDNDTKTLLFHISASLGRAGILPAEDVAVFKFMDGEEAATHGVNHLAHLLGRNRMPLMMMIDNVDVLKSRATRTVIAELVRQLEAKVRFAFASHSDNPVRFPAVRSRGGLLQLTETQLGMSAEETGQLVDELGLDPSVATAVLQATEGWPMATLLAALAVRNGDLDLTRITISEEAHLTEIVKSVILPQMSQARRRFLMLMSPLERMSGSLCDAVTGSEGSQRLLESLRADTHLIHRVDHDDTWFAMNLVLRNSLLAELDRNEPETLRTVHARAAEWYEAHDMPSTAIEHALLANEPKTFARLMVKLMKRSYANGHVADVLEWMAWLQGSTSLDRYPQLAAAGALVHIQEGDSLAAEAWLEEALKGTSGDPHPAVELVRALATRSGTAQMISASRVARAHMATGSEWMPAALLVEGLAHLWDEELDTAGPLLAESATLGEHNQSWPTTTLALAELGWIAVLRNEWDTASDLAARSLSIIETHNLDGYMTSGLGLVLAARCARHRSEIVEARSLLARSASVRPRLSSAVPGVSVQTLLEMARAHLELSDVTGARTLIREAGDVLGQRPDLGRLPQAVDTVREILNLSGAGKVGPTALTRAELRLLPLLATNLSFPEIGDRLFISRHTVKTQAMSIYRKLGTSSRSDAVTKAYDTGLLNR